MIPTLETPRLCLRAWRETDLEPFADLNADERVMEYFPRALDRAESDGLAALISQGFARNGFGVWAVELPGIADFIGYVGLGMPRFQAHFTPCLEIGWRLAFDHWGQGYATEGARAALGYGFETLDYDEIVAFTVPDNRRSRRVMEKLGMSHDASEDFDHPQLPAHHLLRRHVLYRLGRADFRPNETPAPACAGTLARNANRRR